MTSSHTIFSSPREIAADIARELREHPERWCTGQLAKDAEGLATGSKLPDAVAWCLEGHCSARTETIAEYFSVLQRLRVAAGLPRNGELFLWNDAPGRTVEEIVAVCERAALSDEQTNERTGS